MELLRYWFIIISLFILLLGGLNWGVVALFRFNPITWLSHKTFKSLEIVIYALVGIAALAHIFSRDFYLTFLGSAAFPCDSLTEKTPEIVTGEGPSHSLVSVNVHTSPNANIVYWAAESDSEVKKNPWLAYGKYTNAGVVRSDSNGNAQLRVRAPGSYLTPMSLGKPLKVHVHYRVCKSPGMLGRVETVYV